MRNWQAFVRERLKLPELTPERESRIVRELAAQLEDFYREAVARGANATEADAHARRQIADWDRMSRDVLLADRANARPRLDKVTDALDEMARPGGGGAKMAADFLRDMRYGVRQLIKTPGFTIIAILTIALGIGSTSAIFSIVNGVLLRPLPYPDPDTIVRVYEVVPIYGRFTVAPATFLDWRQQNGVFEHIAAYNPGSSTLTGSGGPERVPSAFVSPNLFDLLKISPALGRTFRKEEETPGKNNVVILSHGMWQRRFGGSPSVLDQTIMIDGRPNTIIGVMPAGFYFPARTMELWMPLTVNTANAPRGAHFLSVIARTKPGVPLEQAATEMRTISERLAQQYPESADESAEILPLLEQIVGPVRPALLTLLAAVGIVVLIACANVGNLLLVRASIREKEIAIRSALGAGGRRLGLQMLAESLVLAIAGGVLGVLLAYVAIQPIRTLSAGSIPRVADVVIDARVLAFAAIVSVLTGLIFGLVPAVQASRSTIGHVLKEGGRTSHGAGARWVRSALLTAEVALSIVLLVGATLLLRSFSKLTSVDPGFQGEQVLAFQVSLPGTVYPKAFNVTAFVKRLLDELSAVPQITAASVTQSLPLRDSYVLSVALEGRPAPKPGQEASANYRSVSPEYFETLGVPLLKGRTFTDQDTDTSPMVAIVDKAFVDRHFPNEDPIGRGIDMGDGSDGFYKIVGVVGNVHHEGLDVSPAPTMYVPYAREVFSTMWVLARTNGDAAQLSTAARQCVREIDPTLPAYSMGPLAEAVSESVAQRRFSMLLLAVFAGIAVFLAAVGLYGVVAYSVSQRTQEIGVRMAIGARPGDVLRMVVGGGLKLALIGVAIGIAVTLAVAQVIATMLFVVTPFDPASYALTSLALLAIAALACYVPARRAMRVDPLVALRQE